MSLTNPSDRGIQNRKVLVGSEGTSAHNTLRVDGVEQSVIGGNFMWLKKAKAWCEGFGSDSDKDLVSGVYDGYLRLQDPVLHKGTLELDKDKGALIIEDRLEFEAGHEVERSWHFCESCRVWQEKDCIRAENDGLRICLQCSDSELELVHGQEDPPLGWVSRRFDSKEPTWTAVCKTSIQGEATLRTVVELEK